MPLATVKEEFIIEKQDQRFAKFAGLLDAAHRSGLLSIVTKPLEFPTEENHRTALFFCTVVMLGDDEREHTFTGTADANPANCSPAMALCLPRLAETRSKARALRDAINFAGVALEECYDPDNPETNGPTPVRQNASQSRQAGTGTASRHSATNTPVAPKPTQRTPAASKVQQAQSARVVVAQAMDDNTDTEESRKLARAEFRTTAVVSGIDQETLHSANRLKTLCLALNASLAQIKLVDMTTSHWRELKLRLREYVSDPNNPALPGMKVETEPSDEDRANTMAAIAR